MLATAGCEPPCCGTSGYARRPGQRQRWSQSAAETMKSLPVGWPNRRSASCQIIPHTSSSDIGSPTGLLTNHSLLLGSGSNPRCSSANAARSSSCCSYSDSDHGLVVRTSPGPVNTSSVRSRESGSQPHRCRGQRAGRKSRSGWSSISSQPCCTTNATSLRSWIKRRGRSGWLGGTRGGTSRQSFTINEPPSTAREPGRRGPSHVTARRVSEPSGSEQVVEQPNAAHSTSVPLSLLRCGTCELHRSRSERPPDSQRNLREGRGLIGSVLHHW